MQKSAVKTPTTNKGEGSAAKKLSGKKLVQARLPFKIISSSLTPAAGVSVPSKGTTTPAQDGRKRRLSFEAEDKIETEKEESDALRGRSTSKENLSAKKKKTTDKDDDIILLDDDDILEEDDDKKEEMKDNQNIIKQKLNKNVALASPNTNKSKASIGLSGVNSPNTPKTRGAKAKEIGTPENSNAKTGTPGSAKNKSSSKASGSATKVQIKLPLGSAKSNKRKKTKVEVECVDAELVISSDENDANPKKRQKLESTSEKRAEQVEKVINLTAGLSDAETEENADVLVLEIGGNETDVADSELDSRSSSININSKGTPSKRGTHTQVIGDDIANKNEESHSVKSQTTPQHSKELRKRGGDKQNQGSDDFPTKSNKNVISSSKTKVEPVKGEGGQSRNIKSLPTEETKQKESVIQKFMDTPIIIKDSLGSESSSSSNNESKSHVEKSGTKMIVTPKISREDANTTSKKNLTPKQIKLMEQRRKAREEKESRLQEEKMQKQREKEAKELAKKREREERDEQRRKEREEKDEQKRKEREEKERKRLAELEVKNEEKRKRNEAKEEELRKKEEERKRKEGADLKAKKEAEAFQKFFKAKRTLNADGDASQLQAHQDEGYDPETLAFRPFEVKGDMKLAPLCRKQLSPECRQQLDTCVGARTDSMPQSQDLYLVELRNGKITPGKWRRISVDTKASEDDIQIIDDDLDRAGLAIVEETHAPIEHFRAKFYKFHENRRPPYYGTWRKRTSVIKSRRPFAQDTKCFDYEVDSDLEWEEEEPGESLDGSDDEKEKESEDDDYEVDNEWFVPHGHLSEEELQNEDEILDANTREAQKAKLQVLQQEFAQEMKKKTEKIKPRLIGCIWADENGNQPALCPKIIWDTLNSRAMLCEVPPLLEDPEVPEKSEIGSPTSNRNEKTVEKVKPIKITEIMLKDLVRLVHGNHHSKNFLIKEFIAYLEANEESIKNGEVRGPVKSLVREKIDDFAEWTITESDNLLQNSKKKNKKRLCWIVSADVLKKMDLENLGLRNTWKYTLQPRSANEETTKVEVEVETQKETVTEATKTVANDEEKESKLEGKPKAKTAKNKQAGHHHKGRKDKSNFELTKFAKLLPAKKSPKITSVSETKQDLKAASDDSKPVAKSATPMPTEPAAKVKKRVPLLMSVARGQHISQPVKNALISEFLQKSSAENEASSSKKADVPPTTISKEVSEVVEVD
ncbi:chromatin assembly factor 1 subunit A [Anastrepha ludens]|uniref:chromatin assembly factor 1 subunit A n=1 Tax=Anastrepha ludens TaxID=28586 RepID=UPI0023AFD48F|nr:chromatin assembly factor 1 subunit A [Anastrepha ludens]